jgi:ribokinase
MKKLDFVGFGALNVDKLFKVNRIAGAEEESFVTDYAEACGGSAANTIVGLARLRSKVGFIGKVASDRDGELLLEDFRKESVNTDGIIKVKNGRSGAVMGLVDENGQRALYVDPGVNDLIEFEEINKEHVSNSDFLHLSSFVGEKSFQAQKKLLEILPENVKVSLDTGELHARKGLKALASILRRTFVFLPNARELEILTGETDYKKAAETMLKKGVKIIAVKLGNEGCYVTNGNEAHRIEAVKVKVVDTTGAGDAFNAGFLHGILHDKSLPECGKIGNFAASRCIMKMGARAGLPRLEELERFL